MKEGCKQPCLYRILCVTQVMIAVDEALRRLEVSAPERNAILEAFRYADARNAAAVTTAVAAAQQEAAEAAAAADDHQQDSQPMLTSKPFTRWDHDQQTAMVCCTDLPKGIANSMCKV